MSEIDVAAVRGAADAMEQVAQTVRDPVPDEVGDVAAALAGSASAGAGSALATAWADSYAHWATSADTHAQSMRTSADSWTGTNEYVATRFDRLGPVAS